MTRPRGMIAVTVHGYYRATGEPFHESVDLPVELVPARPKDEEEGKDKNTAEDKETQ